MYLCYVDESGDCGRYDAVFPERSGSKYFILVALITPIRNWKSSLDVLKSYRKRIAAQGYLNYDVEFHCAELIDPHKIKAFTQINVQQRWKLIEGFAEAIGQHGSLSGHKKTPVPNRGFVPGRREPYSSLGQDKAKIQIII